MHWIIHCRWEALVETIFVQVKCGPGSAYSVAQTLADMDGVSEVYSVSGPYDLLVKCHLEEDVGHFVNEKIHLVDDVVDTSTIITFNAFN